MFNIVLNMSYVVSLMLIFKTVFVSTETPTVCPRVLTTGEIVAIVLGIVFVQLLTIGISVCCCCPDKCASLCGGKKERISPQPPPKRVEIPVYYEEPDESVISLRKLEIPQFKNDTEKLSKKPNNKYSRHTETSYDFEINKSQVLQSDDFQQFRHSDTSYDFEINKSRVLQPEDFKQPDQIHITSYNAYSDITPSYEEEEKHRKRWLKKNNKKKRIHHQQIRDNEFILEDKRDNVNYYVPR